MDWASLLLEHGIDVPVERTQFNIPCPFHQDTIASCSINTEQGVWICFAGCGQGSLFGFFMKYLNLSYEELEHKVQQNVSTLDINIQNIIKKLKLVMKKQKEK